MVIYKTTNLVNGKIYIGQDSNNDSNYLGSGKLLKLAIKKYGKENFKKEILMECVTQEELDMFEKKFILEFDSQNKEIGYNISIGGRDGMTLGRCMSNETKKKISESRKGVKLSKRTKKKMSLAKCGRKMPDEVKKKISLALKGRKQPPMPDAVKKKISDTKKGKKVSPETKKKMSESKIGGKNSFYGSSHSNETKKQISIKNSKKVIKYDTNDKIIKEWDSLTKCAKEINVSISYLSACIKNNKLINGAIYRYEESNSYNT